MNNRGQFVLGLVVIVVGVVFLIGNVFDVDAWAICWPVGLILLGIGLFLHPQLISSEGAVRQKLIGDIRCEGAWQVADEEFWIGIGDVRLDMTSAEIPLGESQIRVFGFVGDVALRVPQDVGVSVSSTAFVTDVKVLGRKREGFVAPVQVISDDYETAERKIRLETSFFVSGVKVRQGN